MKLSELFKELSPWLLELEGKSLYNDPIMTDGYYYYIYCWVNLDTQWCYVGKHKSTNAFNEESYMGSCGNPHYWNSMKIHEYNCSILGYYDSASINDAEYYFIDHKFLSTYSHNGIYNLQVGGLGGFTSEMIAKCLVTNRANHGGTLAWNSIESIKKSIDTRTRLYGSPMSLCHTDEVRKVATKSMINTCIERYGSVMHGCHTEDAIKKRYESEIKNHGRLVMLDKENQQKAYNTIAARYNGDPHGQIHTEESYKKAAKSIRLSSLFNTIKRQLDLLDSMRLDLTLHNYKSIGFSRLRAAESHIKRVLGVLSDLRSDPRWDTKMDIILNDLIN